MIKNYLITALRFLKQNKVFASINMMGLSIALASSFIILLYVINELSYNYCHKNREQVYRVLNYNVDSRTTQSGTSFVLATALKKEFPQVEHAIRTRPVRLKLKLKDEYINVPNAIATDSEVFDIFTLPLVGGSPKNNLLDDSNSIVLSREIAEKIFGNTNPVGKEMVGTVNNQEYIFNVKGVFENIPVNSTFKAKCFVNNRYTIDDINKSFKITNAETSWNHDFWITWVLFSKNSDKSSIEKQFRAFEVKNIGEKPNRNFSLQNLSDVYLKSDDVMNTGIKGNINNVRLFMMIALLILIVAAINYIILSTAVSSGRAKEIGVRKTNGAGIHAIRNQLLSESVLLVLLVLPIALILAWFGLPYAGKLFQTQLQIIPSNVILYILIYFLLTVFIGIASGLYTSAYLSRLTVIDILRGKNQSGKTKLFFRSAMIVVQLVIFCSFVSGTLIIRAQYKYSLEKDPGYNNKNILLIELGRDFKGYSAYINKIRSHPNVIMAAGVMQGLPMMGSMFSTYPHFKDKEVKVVVEGLAIDYKFLKTMGIPVIAGRDFSEEYGGDLKKSAILNEKAVSQLGITDPIGENFYGITIIGVVKDFNLHSIRTDVPALMITLTDQYIQQVAVHYVPGTLHTLLPVLESEWKKAGSGRPFDYSTIEDLIEGLYTSERNLSNIISIVSLFTMLIAAFGLFGLTLFVAKNRTKEIGIKKVFGSSEQLIVFSFLRESFILVLVAALISIPITIYFMTRWLNDFAYKADISWWIFLVAFVIAAIVVLSTVVIHSIRASRINPVEALRYE